MKEQLKDLLETTLVMIYYTVLAVILTFLIIGLFWAGFKILGIEIEGEKIRVEVVEKPERP